MPSAPSAVLIPLPRRVEPTTSEATRFYPRPGRAAPAHLQALPTLPPLEEERTVYAQPTTGATWEDILRMRGELPPTPAPNPPRAKAVKAPKAPRAPVAPWNRKGFVYPSPEDKEGKARRVEASARDDVPSMRATPKNLTKLLATPEWKGASVVGTAPSPELGSAEREMKASQSRVADAEREIASIQERLAAPEISDAVSATLEVALGRARHALAQRKDTLASYLKRLEQVRAEEWIHVVHPCGAEIRIRPNWGE